MTSYTLLTENDNISPQGRHSTGLQTNIFVIFIEDTPFVSRVTGSTNCLSVAVKHSNIFGYSY